MSRQYSSSSIGGDSEYSESYEHEEDAGLLRKYLPQPLSRAAVSPGKRRWTEGELRVRFDEQTGSNSALRDSLPPPSMGAAHASQTPLPGPSQSTRPTSPQLPQLGAAVRLELFRTLVGMHSIDDTSASIQRSPYDNMSAQVPALPWSSTIKRHFIARRPETLPLPQYINTRPATNLGVYYRILRAENNAQLSYRFYATLVNCLYLLQVVLSAAITGISAYSSSSRSPTSISITVMGALSAATAGVLAYLKARNLPTRKLLYKNQLRRVREYAEWRERQFAIDAKIGVVGYATEETKSTTENFNAAFYPDATSGGTYIIDPHREAEIVSQMYLAARQAEQANAPEVWAAVPGTGGVGASTSTKMNWNSGRGSFIPHDPAEGRHNPYTGNNPWRSNDDINPYASPSTGPAMIARKPVSNSDRWAQPPTVPVSSSTTQPPPAQAGAPPPHLTVTPDVAAQPAAPPPADVANMPQMSARVISPSTPTIT